LPFVETVAKVSPSTLNDNSTDTLLQAVRANADTIANVIASRTIKNFLFIFLFLLFLVYSFSTLCTPLSRARRNFQNISTRAKRENSFTRTYPLRGFSTSDSLAYQPYFLYFIRSMKLYPPRTFVNRFRSFFHDFLFFAALAALFRRFLRL